MSVEDPPVSALLVLGLQSYTTMPSFSVCVLGIELRPCWHAGMASMLPMEPSLSPLVLIFFFEIELSKLSGSSLWSPNVTYKHHGQTQTFPTMNY